jgi:hypothetical protein
MDTSEQAILNETPKRIVSSYAPNAPGWHSRRLYY